MGTRNVNKLKVCLVATSGMLIPLKEGLAFPPNWKEWSFPFLKSQVQ